MNWLRPLLPNRISGQIAMLIAISLIVFHLVLTAWFFLYHHDHEHAPERLATLIELVAAAAPDARPALLRDIRAAFPRFELASAGTAADDGLQAGGDKDAAGFAHRLGPRYRLRSLESASQASAAGGHMVAVTLPDGQSLTARLTAPPSPVACRFRSAPRCSAFGPRAN